ISVTWLTPAFAVTAAHWACCTSAFPFTVKWNVPATDLQTVIVGLTLLALLTVALALPATKKLLPMAITGAMSSNKAECLRTFLYTMLSSHLCRPLPHPRTSGSGRSSFPHCSGESGTVMLQAVNSSHCCSCSISACQPAVLVRFAQ